MTRRPVVKAIIGNIEAPYLNTRHSTGCGLLMARHSTPGVGRSIVRGLPKIASSRKRSGAKRHRRLSRARQQRYRSGHSL